MSKLIIAGLVVVWAVVLLPDVLRRFSTGRRSDTIGSFRSQLSSLGRTNGSPSSRSNVIDLRTRTPRSVDPMVVRRPARAEATVAAAPRPVSPKIRKRRQDVLITLGSAVVLTLLATVAFGGPFLYLQLLADVLLIAYLLLLAQVSGVQATVPAPQVRREELAPLSPLDGLRTGSVGVATPFEPSRLAN
jgi:hypothetical protein